MLQPATSHNEREGLPCKAVGEESASKSSWTGAESALALPGHIGRSMLDEASSALTCAL